MTWVIVYTGCVVRVTLFSVIVDAGWVVTETLVVILVVTLMVTVICVVVTGSRAGCVRVVVTFTIWAPETN